jgi:hypothetical protein
MIYRKPFLNHFIKKIIRTNKSYEKFYKSYEKIKSYEKFYKSYEKIKSYEKLLTILYTPRLIPKPVNILDYIISFNMQWTPPRS